MSCRRPRVLLQLREGGAVPPVRGQTEHERQMRAGEEAQAPEVKTLLFEARSEAEHRSDAQMS